jgi:MoaA/NifB/PqqE/SkfB family radical SAM enzyme
MMDTKILRLAAGTVRSSILNYIIIKTGIDFTSPVHVYAQLNYRCNSKCKMCNEWRVKDPELPAAIWNKALMELKSLSTSIKMSFAGGEIFVKKDLFEILEFCHNQNIIFGITTNGILLDRKTIERLMALNPFNINISIDSTNGKTYEEIRGVDCLDTVRRNLDSLMQYKGKVGAKTTISIKSVVCRENIYNLHKIAEYAMEMKVAGITFQPIIETTAECKEMMSVDQERLIEMMDKLIAMKKAGFNIMNSESNIRSWPNHFDKENPVHKESCSVPLRNLYILPNGNMQLCDYVYNTIGNIAKNNILDILCNDDTKILKKELIHCKKRGNCSYCVQRTMKDYALLAYKFVT